MRHPFDGRFRYYNGTLYILVPETTANYLAKQIKGSASPVELHGEPCHVEVEA